MSIRYGQLAYTSFDKPGFIGGWQTKQVTGALSAAEAQTLVAGVRTAFDPVDPLPTYPAHEQLERAPRRLAYRRIDARRAAYWHTVPAGSDSTGRPGTCSRTRCWTENPRRHRGTAPSSGGDRRSGCARTVRPRSPAPSCPTSPLGRPWR